MGAGMGATFHIAPSRPRSTRHLARASRCSTVAQTLLSALFAASIVMMQVCGSVVQAQPSASISPVLPSGLVAWLDSADPAAVAYSPAGAPVAGVTRVRQVLDKGSFGGTYAAPSEAAYPFYNGSACPLYFDGVSSVLSTSAFTAPWGGGSVTLVFAVSAVSGYPFVGLAYRAPPSQAWNRAGMRAFTIEADLVPRYQCNNQGCAAAPALTA